MKITMIGTGYVGLVSGTCFAESGNDVVCLDIDRAKIDALKQGEVPIYEPGLSELISRNAQSGRLAFSTDYSQCVPESDCVFIAVGTPQDDDGSADLSAIWKVVESMAPHLSEKTIVVTKSTVPVGTNRRLYERLKELAGREVAVASNPEFLKEGAAIQDFSKPDRVVVGVFHEETGEVLRELYKPFLRTEHPFLVMDPESAEMTKYVANCMLATKISFINEIANLCEKVNADINNVRRGIGHDSRIGFSFLFPGAGYGGSCFPKDVRALASVAESVGGSPEILRTVDEINTAQKKVLYRKISAYFDNDLSNRRIAIWGLSFKPGTDDVREAPSRTLIDGLLAASVKEIRVHDPVARDNIRKIYGDRLTYCDHHYDALDDADALAIVTEWNEFRNPDFSFMKHKMKRAAVFDGRNLYDPRKMADAGFYYSGIGLPVIAPTDEP